MASRRVLDVNINFYVIERLILASNILEANYLDDIGVDRSLVYREKAVKIERKEALFLNPNVSDKTVFQFVAETDQEAVILKEMITRMKREDGTLRILESGKTDLVLWVPWAGYPR